jgi:hypothetical protein
MTTSAQFLDAVVQVALQLAYCQYTDAFKPTNFKLTLCVDTALIAVALPFCFFRLLVVIILLTSELPL